MPGFPSSVVPMDIPSVASVDPSFTLPANTTISQVPLGSSSASSLRDSIPWGHSHQGFGEDYHSPNSLPGGLGFDRNLAIPPGLGVDAPTMNVIPGHYGADYRDGSVQRPVSQRQKSEQSTRQTVRQGGPYQRCPCWVDGCHKEFATKSEMMRHAKSMHEPPGIGCKGCDYKCSRIDAFKQHCKKDHSNELAANLQVDIRTPEQSRRSSSYMGR